MLNERTLEIIEELGKLPIEGIEAVGELQEELKASGYISYLDASTDYLIVEKNCIERLFVNCNHCGELVKKRDACSDNDKSYCIDCFQSYYQNCETCGDIISNNDLIEIRSPIRQGRPVFRYHYCVDCAYIERVNREV